jgi:hypothetical protein
MTKSATSGKPEKKESFWKKFFKGTYGFQAAQFLNMLQLRQKGKRLNQEILDDMNRIGLK